MLMSWVGLYNILKMVILVQSRMMEALSLSMLITKLVI